MTRKKWLAVLTAIFTLALACGLFAACAGKTEYALTWRVDENVTVSVEDAEGLPELWTEGEALVFTVTPPSSAYEITVRAGNKIIAEENGKYTVNVTNKTTIVIQAEKNAQALEVVQQPEKLTYSIGEAVDTTGMVLQLKFKDASTETLTADDYTVSPSSFHGGETYFTVIYKTDKNLRVEVPLASPVMYTATLALNGGTLNDKTIKDLDGYTETAGDNGNVTVSFNYYLAEGETLDLSVSRDGYKFLGWMEGIVNRGNVTLTHETQSIVDLSADWQFTIVEITSVGLKTAVNPDNTAAGEKPYLILSGIFYAADTAQLYLYEGNMGLSLTGTTVSGNQGETFTLYFDLTDLATAAEQNNTIYGAWMDIRMNAMVDGTLQTQEIFITDSNDMELNLSDKVIDGWLAYTFATWTNEDTGRTALKLVVNQLEYTYSLSFDASAGTPTLTLAGRFDIEKHANLIGANLRIDWWQDGGSWDEAFCTVGQDGSWSVSFDLSKSVNDKKTYFHLSAKSADGQTEILASTDMALASCTNYVPDTTLNPSLATMTDVMTFESGNTCYYIGSGDNVTGLMFVSTAKTDA